uniref:EamA family transporter n=1 Tax=Thaumasiovibrio occultus TaxID=1891184 RepID=UPI000B35204E|nr:EamA family transporter [Thaumasiovibrio occultus]
MASRISIMFTMAITAIAPMVWGSTYIVTTEWLPANSPLMAATIRALPAGLVLVAIGRVLPRGHWWLKLALLGALNIGFFFYSLFYAAAHLPGGIAAMVMSVQSLMLVGLSWLWLKMTFSRMQLVSVGLAMGGLALLVLNNPTSLSIKGISVALLGALGMAVGVVATRKWGRPENMSLLGFTGWQLLFGGLLLLPLAWWQEGLPSALTRVNLLGYGYLSVVGSMLGYALWFRGIEKLPPMSVSLLGFISSISASVLGYLFLGQALSWIQLLGVVVIFVSLILSVPSSKHSGEKRTKETAPKETDVAKDKVSTKSNNPSSRGKSLTIEGV